MTDVRLQNPVDRSEGRQGLLRPACIDASCSRLRTVDLFAGCGGMSLGLQQAGLEVVAAFDNWAPAISVYRENFEHPIHELDLASDKAVERVAKVNPNIIVGGPPCQDFSSAGPNQRNGGRAGLTGAFARIVTRVRPQFFVFENVPRARLSNVYSESKRIFSEAGYGLTELILDASLCGVPQTRKRLILVGAWGEQNDFLKGALLSRLASEPLTMRNYFGEELSIDHYFRVPTNYNRRGIFSVDMPCTTIRAIDRPLPKGYKGHKDDPVPVSAAIRGLTVRERSRVQTFPAGFRLHGTKTNLNTMIGNAVPVNLARYVGEALKSYIDDGAGRL